MDQFTAQQQQGSPAVSVASQPSTPAPGSSSASSTAAGPVSSASSTATAAGSAPAFQPDEDSRTLYVGNLDQNVNEAALQELFAQAGGAVESVKIIRDKNFAHQGGLNYGFVEFADHATAEQALQAMNGYRVFHHELKVNWAFTGQMAGKEDTASHYHIFIGDISPEINDEALSKAFGVFGTMTDARVMWDANSGKSRGYGFAAYKERTDAERAITTMNGQILGNRAVRCNWASQRGMPGPAFHPHGMHHGGNSFKMVTGQAPQFNTTVYVGNLPPHTTQEDLVPFFQPFGFVVDMRLQAERGFAFVKLETHEKAANAIVRLAGTMINGRPAKLSWGKDRTAENVARNNAYGYYNNGSGYPMGGHQNNGAYPYSYNNNHNNHNGHHHNNHHNNSHYGGNGQAYGRNGPHGHHQHHNQHHNQHHHQHHHQNQHQQHQQHHQNSHHMNQHHGQHAFHQQQQMHHQQQQQQQQAGGLDGVPGATGSSALAAGSSAMPPSNVGSNGGNNGQEAFDQFNQAPGAGFGGSR
ncbi:hypothetical protein BGZ70_001908 [Mortierella alpina]|uniref:RRM domain-containing protein n=1 Tax=Mortierella alpina TaxID=64518 RepID=A0A9P6LXN6_MORAP|nr:hypothetical protein BGZ70_001908 [Mortierella alpina]